MNAEQIQKEFSEVMAKLEQDPSMKRFRQEYSNLFLAFSQSQERLKGYQSQYQELRETMLQESYGVETAIQQSKNDEALKRKISEQIEGVRALIQSLQERDEKNQQRVLVLKQNIDQINQTIKNWQLINNSDDQINELNSELSALALDLELSTQRLEELKKSN